MTLPLNSNFQRRYGGKTSRGSVKRLNNSKYLFVLIGSGYYYDTCSLGSVRAYAWHRLNPDLKSF